MPEHPSPDGSKFKKPETDFQIRLNEEYDKALEEIQSQPHASEATTGDSWLADQLTEGQKWLQKQEGMLKDSRAKIESFDPTLDIAKRDPKEVTEYLQNAKDDELLLLLDDSAAELWSKEGFRSAASAKVVNILKNALGDEGRRLSATEQAFRTRTVESFGISKDQAEATWSAWASFKILDETTGKPDKEKVNELVQIIDKNFEAMDHLEHYRPGSIAELQAAPYGIQHFGRYDPPNLIWQLENPHAKVDRVVLTGSGDWNGAFRDVSQHMDYLHGESISDQPKTVFIEAGRVKDAGEQLETVAKQRGKIKKLYLNAHGNEEVLALKSTPEGRVTKSNISELIRPDVLALGSETFLLSCETGKGIAKDIATQTDTRVISPQGKAIGYVKHFGLAPRLIDAEGKKLNKTYGPGRIHSRVRRVLDRLRPSRQEKRLN